MDRVPLAWDYDELRAPRDVFDRADYTESGLIRTCCRRRCGAKRNKESIQ